MTRPETPMSMIASLEYVDRGDGKFWLDVFVDGERYGALAFDSEAERAAARDDMVSMLYSVGGKDVPVLPQ